MPKLYLLASTERFWDCLFTKVWSGVENGESKVVITYLPLPPDLQKARDFLRLLITAVGGCGRRNKLTGKYVKSQTHSIGWYYAPTPECFLNMHGLLMAPNGLSPQITFSWGTSCASQTALLRHSYDSRPVLKAVQTTQAVSTPHWWTRS